MHSTKACLSNSIYYISYSKTPYIYLPVSIHNGLQIDRAIHSNLTFLEFIIATSIIRTTLYSGRLEWIRPEPPAISMAETPSFSPTLPCKPPLKLVPQTSQRAENISSHPRSPVPITWFCHKCVAHSRLPTVLSKCLSCSQRFCPSCILKNNQRFGDMLKAHWTPPQCPELEDGERMMPAMDSNRYTHESNEISKYLPRFPYSEPSRWWVYDMDAIKKADQGRNIRDPIWGSSTLNPVDEAGISTVKHDHCYKLKKTENDDTCENVLHQESERNAKRTSTKNSLDGDEEGAIILGLPSPLPTEIYEILSDPLKGENECNKLPDLSPNFTIGGRNVFSTLSGVLNGHNDTRELSSSLPTVRYMYKENVPPL